MTDSINKTLSASQVKAMLRRILTPNYTIRPNVEVIGSHLPCLGVKVDWEALDALIDEEFESHTLPFSLFSEPDISKKTLSDFRFKPLSDKESL